MNFKAIVSTSANPFHYGHFQIFQKAVETFGSENVSLVVAQNDNKQDNDIGELLFHIVPYNIKNTIILPKGILLADFMKNNNIKYNVRGIRNAVDMEYENSLDAFNKRVNPDMETVMFFTDSSFNHLSSSSVRALLKYNKIDNVKGLMNEDSLYRYIHKKPSFNVFFGRSCVGKSTALSKLNASILDVDKFIWNVFAELYGKDTVIMQKEKSYNKIFVEQKFQEFEENCHKLLTNKFWDLFFEKLFKEKDNAPLFLVDFAALGFYWEMIPVKYRTLFRLTRITNSKEKRMEFAIKKGFQDKIEILDKFYKDCPYFDDEINLEKNS